MNSLVKTTEMRCNMTFFHGMPLVLALASCNADSIVYGAIDFSEANENEVQYTFLSHDAIVISVDIT